MGAVGDFSSKVVAEGEFSPYILAREDGSKEYKYSIFSSPFSPPAPIHPSCSLSLTKTPQIPYM
ncbi:hypothetical protein L873DRAFT_1797363 [Choiromyces venosus 120613-1]|uniref:Uncharacterized protein n=1 Tax=Choiromyces venosus 120613-1 TaxID=1336337 RepID=A0A3N4K8H2_9PEZI|nr:hypothetical protein L873DRAFT_1797363 [Choiromyces venosus 120613-1]